MTILVVSCLMLVPGQSYGYIGAEISIIGIGVYILVTKMDMDIYTNIEPAYKKQYFLSVVFNQLSILPYLLGGVTILIYGDKGVYWIVPAIVLSFIKAVVDAWVLLVEINRQTGKTCA